MDEHSAIRPNKEHMHGTMPESPLMNDTAGFPVNDAIAFIDNIKEFFRCAVLGLTHALFPAVFTAAGQASRCWRCCCS